MAVPAVITASRANIGGTSLIGGTCTPTGDRTLYLAVVHVKVGGTAASAIAAGSLSGNGWAASMTWTQMATTLFSGTEARLTLYRGTSPSSPASGNVTGTFDQSEDAWWTEIYEVDATEAPAQAVVSNTGSSTAMSATLGSTPGGSNTAIGYFCALNLSGVTSHAPGTGYTEASEYAPIPEAVNSLVYDETAPSDGVVDATVSPSSTWAAIAWELDEGGGGGSVVPIIMAHHG